jgi:hypothetical protein
MPGHTCSCVSYLNSTAGAVWAAGTDPQRSAAYWAHHNVSDWRADSTWEHQRIDGSGIADDRHRAVPGHRPPGSHSPVRRLPARSSTAPAARPSPKATIPAHSGPRSLPPAVHEAPQQDDSAHVAAIYTAHPGGNSWLHNRRGNTNKRGEAERPTLSQLMGKREAYAATGKPGVRLPGRRGTCGRAYGPAPYRPARPCAGGRRTGRPRRTRRRHRTPAPAPG